MPYNVVYRRRRPLSALARQNLRNASVSYVSGRRRTPVYWSKRTRTWHVAGAMSFEIGRYFNPKYYKPIGVRDY